MGSDSRFYSFTLDIDRAISAALGLTDYVARPRERLGTSVGKTSCNHFFEPRAILNLVLSQWLRGDEPTFRSGLGPESSQAVDALAAGRDWRSFWTLSWHGRDDPKAAVGYRFVSEGWWLKETAAMIGITPDEFTTEPQNPSIEVAFYTSSGRPCGSRRVDFKGHRSVKQWVADAGLGLAPG